MPIGGGAGGSTVIQYPALKPASPTDDFRLAALDGAWSVHSAGGSFVLADCITQGEAWGGSSLEMQFSGQMGTIYRTHGDTDLDFTVGGIRAVLGPDGATGPMFGIAALDSAGTGIGVTVYNDNSAYLAAITTYGYVTNSDSVGLGMISTGIRQHNGIWLRLKRVSGTWTGYASVSGRAWDKVFTTRADSVTVAQLHFGLLLDPANTYHGRLSADYFHQAA